MVDDKMFANITIYMDESKSGLVLSLLFIQWNSEGYEAHWPIYR